MQSRDGVRRRRALRATALGLVLCLAAAFAVWVITADRSVPAAGVFASPGASVAASRAGASGPPATAGAQGSVGAGRADAQQLDDQAASEDAAAGRNPGQPQPAKGSSFGGEVGTYQVGRGIPPGAYETAGGHGGRRCQWSRLKGLSAAPGDVLASGSSDGPARVTILATDAFFQTKDCAPWRRAAG
jgi:hypothetical protein